MYCQRYESLGVLCFSCIMATLSVVVIGQSATDIYKVSTGEKAKLKVDMWSLIILGVTIVVKAVLFILCYVSNRM